jgi:hypothetical protein
MALAVVFSFVASRVSARRPSSFLLLRQKKGTKEKASPSQGRCAVPCAARSGRVGRKLGCASNMRPPDPPAAALLSPVSMATKTNSQPQPQLQLRSFGFAIANSLPRPKYPAASSAGNPAGARSLARLLFAYFLLAKQEKVCRLPGRDPACLATKNPTKSPTC